MPVKEAAESLGLHYLTIRSWCIPGGPGCPHLGGRILNGLWVTSQSTRWPRPLLLLLNSEVEEIHLAILNRPEQSHSDAQGTWIPTGAAAERAGVTDGML